MRKLIALALAASTLSLAACGGSTQTAPKVASSGTGIDRRQGRDVVGRPGRERDRARRRLPGRVLDRPDLFAVDRHDMVLRGTLHATLKSVKAEYGNDPDYPNWDKQAIARSETKAWLAHRHHQRRRSWVAS